MNEDNMGPMSAYDIYVSEEMMKPGYRRIKIGLDRCERSVVRIASGQGYTSRGLALAELDEVLKKLQELESLAENVPDSFVWEHVIDRIDMISSLRRHLVAEIRWEVQADKNCQASA